MNHGEISMRCEVWILYDGIPDILILINTIMTYHITIYNDTITFILDSVDSHIEYTYDNIIIPPNMSIRIYSIFLIFVSKCPPNPAPNPLDTSAPPSLEDSSPWPKSGSRLFRLYIHVDFGLVQRFGLVDQKGPEWRCQTNPVSNQNLDPFHQLWIALVWGRMNCECLIITV